MSSCCDNCGHSTSGGVAFCEECGARVPEAGSSGLPADRPDPASPHGRPAPTSKSWTVNDVARTVPRRTRRAQSSVWIYYALLTLLCFIAGITGQPMGFVGMLLFGAYATYIYRGGRIIFWFW